MLSCGLISSSKSAYIEFGQERDELDFELSSKGSTFAVGKEFYYLFNNSKPFNDSVLKIQLIDSETDKIILEHDYQVEADNTLYSDKIGFNEIGKYKIVFLINGDLRAMSEVIIE